MTLKVTGFASTLATYKLINDADSDENAETDVTGSSGILYAVDVSNGAGTNTSYLKMKLTEGTVTVGTTEPDLMLVAGPNTAVHYEFPNGIPFSQLSFWTTRNPVTTDTTAPNQTTVTILAS
tara:strand:+ start:1135 stop:1500 length:366 start_codon:yes stop_codon:yes gene_type:complete